MSVTPSLGFTPYAGIATSEEVTRLGYDVAENAALLHRYLFVESQLTRIMTAHLSAVPEWEVKAAFSLHLWQDAEHSQWLRERVRNMRFPAPNLDKVPDPRLAEVMEELLRAEDTLELLVGIYRVIKPALVAAYERHPERFVQGAPKPLSMPDAVWINPPAEKTTRQDAPGATISTPDDLEHPPSFITYELSAGPADLAETEVRH